MRTGTTPMLLRKRQQDNLRRRSLWAAALFATSPVWFAGLASAEEVPTNRLRLLNSPVVVPSATGNVSTTSKEGTKTTLRPATDPKSFSGSMESAVIFPLDYADGDAEPIQTTRPRRTATGLQLVSDGWNARDAIDNSLPLLDPPPAKPAYAVKAPSDAALPPSAQRIQSPGTTATPLPSSAGASKAFQSEPRSTLNFVIPERSRVNLAEPVLPKKVTAVEAKPVGSQPNKVLANDLYGPGAAIESISSKPSNAITTKLEIESKLEALADDELSLNPVAVADPEQNEPERIPANPTQPSEKKALVDDASDAEPSDADERVWASDDAEEISENESEEPVTGSPQRIEVRDLKLGFDGSIDGKTSGKVQRAEPVSNRNEARQSIGDETIEPLPPAVANDSIDHIGPRGDLILAIGLGNSNNRVSATTSRLRVPLERTLNYYWNKPEDADERTHWGMFHQMMIYDKDTVITHRKKKYNAVAWMAGNNQSRSQLLFDEDNGGIFVKTGVGVQGHQAQMLAVFGLIDVPASYPLYVGRKKYTVEDVLRREMLECKSGNELTFTLIGVAHYLDTDTRWVSNDGQDWDFERLIQEELSQPIVGAACGGTHRLMGFAHALRRRRAEGKPITGQWERADRYINDFIQYTWQLQNRDGSMSTSWFEKSEDNGKMDRKVQTTGHMVEFLLTALPDDQLQSPEMLRAMTFLVNTLYQERGHEWQVGPKGHALRALSMYYRRVFGRPDPWRPVAVAQQGSTRSR